MIWSKLWVFAGWECPPFQLVGLDVRRLSVMKYLYRRKRDCVNNLQLGYCRIVNLWQIKEIKKLAKIGGSSLMDEVNHVKMVDSFVLFVVLVYFLVYMMVMNAVKMFLFGEGTTKIFILQTSWMLYSLKVSGVHYIWYQSKSWNSRAYWAQNAPACFVLTNDGVFICETKNPQVLTVRPIQVKLYPTHMFIDLVVVKEKEGPLWILGKKVNLEILAQKFQER